MNKKTKEMKSVLGNYTDLLFKNSNYSEYRMNRTALINLISLYRALVLEYIEYLDSEEQEYSIISEFQRLINSYSSFIESLVLRLPMEKDKENNLKVFDNGKEIKYMEHKVRDLLSEINRDYAVKTNKKKY